MSTIQNKVIEHLRGLPIHTELPTCALTEAIGQPELGGLDLYLCTGVESHSIVLRSAGGIKYWSLSASCWFNMPPAPAAAANAAESAPATKKRGRIVRVKLDPLAAAIAGRGELPEVLKLAPTEPPPPTKAQLAKAARIKKAKEKKRQAQVKAQPKAAERIQRIKADANVKARAILAKSPSKAANRPAAPSIQSTGISTSPIPENECNSPPKPPRATNLKNLQQRDDFPELSMGTEKCPLNATRHATSYANFFAGVKVDGPPIKCQTKDIERVRVALRNHLNRTLGVNKFQIRSIKDFASDKTSRLWVQAKESK